MHRNTSQNNAWDGHPGFGLEVDWVRQALNHQSRVARPTQRSMETLALTLDKANWGMIKAVAVIG